MIQKPKGTRDLLPSEVNRWKHVEQKIEELFINTGFKEIRIPVFEHTELYQRGVGETTDVVQKEMYTFEDKGKRSITLRPEGTAGVVRSYLENGMSSLPAPIKLWYNITAYRYENVQKGRQREFHQIGAELIGTESYLADAEVILMADSIFKHLNIPNIKLEINNIGCPICRKEYQNVLREKIRPNIEAYCEDCKQRLEKNPMRILDCKKEQCQKNNENIPSILEYLCEECKNHYENLNALLDQLGYNYTINPNIVRGLDYYTKTVFEFIDEKEGYTVLAGGRYDGLIKELEGQNTPAIGFALGLERLMQLYEKNNPDIETKKPDLFIATMGEEANLAGIKIAQELRERKQYIETDICNRSIKAQFKYANKIGSKFVLTIGEEEIRQKKAKLKNMENGEEKDVVLTAEDIIANIK